MNFFIDTADTSAIKSIWNKLEPHIHGTKVAGITTNPSAMSKVNIHDMDAFNTRVTELCELVTTIRQDNQGVVYVQYPSSKVNIVNLVQWVKHIIKLTDGCTKVGIKIPPFVELLRFTNELSKLADVNVTGVADCSTALMCLSYNIRYVSIIPGRMEEAGLKADEHLLYVDHRNKLISRPQEVITGSMRTLDGLARAISFNTVPTIGTKVFDLIFANGIDKFVQMWNVSNSNSLPFSPLVVPTNTELSELFFKQMDEAGLKLAGDIRSRRVGNEA